MSFTIDLVNGVAAYLASNPNATQPLVWKADSVYDGPDFGVYALTAPLKRVSRTLVIAPFGPESDLTLSDDTVSLQLDARGSKAEVVRVMDDAFDRLQGFWGGKIGVVAVQSVARTSVANLGSDEAGNFRQTQNYDLKVYRPSTHRQ
ncbi:tail terminator [Microbacterium phage Milani]|nr:tail terminator [Microbacterium phage Milani]